MRALLQRVTGASVSVAGQEIARINKGILLLLGIAEGDQKADADWLAKKIVALRIFYDDKGRFERSLLDIEGEVLLVSQFTLHADCRKGTRPSFGKAAKAELAEPLYEYCAQALRREGAKVSQGQFGADMALELINDGPVTLLLESKK